MSKLQIVQALPAPGGGPAGLTYDGRHLWSADYATGTLYALDPASGEVTDHIICPGVLSGVGWDGQALWQALMDEGWLRKVNPHTHDYDRTIVIEDHGRLAGVAWDGELLWVVSQQRGALLGVDRKQDRVMRQLEIPVAAGGVTFREGTLWLSYPDRMTYSAGQFHWTGDEQRFALAHLDPQSGRELTRYEMDFLALGLAWVGDDLWLSSAAQRQLYRAVITE